MYYKSFKKNPTAHITVGKQRLKQNGSVVYLKDGDEFEVEIFNPQQNSVLAKLKINGNYIGGGGVVLKPGQRVFLERYLDEARKFKFETYEVVFVILVIVGTLPQISNYIVITPPQVQVIIFIPQLHLIT